MSIATEITRIQELRNSLRSKLISMLGIPSTADFEDCVAAVEGIAEKGAMNAGISAANQEISIEAGYHNGSGKVAIHADERAKLVPENIKAGTTILGVQGNCSTADSVNIQAAKSVTPTKSAQSVTPDSGYDALAGVNVAAIPDNYADIGGVTAAAGDVLSGKVFVDGAGAESAGTMANNGAINASINGTTATSYTIPAGYHNGSGSVQLDSTIETALAAI
ncbi:MAG: hypothetical protein IJ466_00360 [Clostridia bacterium]|nr:hypothetical protein [Clostridia bacterium]